MILMYNYTENYRVLQRVGSNINMDRILGSVVEYILDLFSKLIEFLNARK